MFSVAYILVFAVAFLLGSIPWGVIISKVFFKKDIRQEGSGNIGTTNAMRSMGKVGGSAVFVLDFGKGLLSGFLGLVFASTFNFTPGSFEYQICCACAFIGCVSGHIYSPWLGFHGGKGIAVAVGALFIVFGPVGACLELLLFAVLVLLTRYVSVGSIAAAVACPFFALFFYWGNIPAIVLITIPALLVIYAHRQNISRLMNHCENRIGSKKVKN
ncbi:MAG: glycerol-3-phosphate 1-O-acyltransferase PlsY [Anaerotardibacter sp.]